MRVRTAHIGDAHQHARCFAVRRMRGGEQQPGNGLAVRRWLRLQQLANDGAAVFPSPSGAREVCAQHHAGRYIGYGVKRCLWGNEGPRRSARLLLAAIDLHTLTEDRR